MSILSENLRSVSLNSHTRGDYPLAPASTANTWSQDLKDSARSIDRTVHASNPKPDVPLAQPISSTPQLRVNNKSLWSRMVRWYEDPVNSNIPEDEAQVVQAMISSSKPYAMTGLLTRSLHSSYDRPDVLEAEADFISGASISRSQTLVPGGMLLKSNNRPIGFKQLETGDVNSGKNKEKLKVIDMPTSNKASEFQHSLKRLKNARQNMSWSQSPLLSSAGVASGSHRQPKPSSRAKNTVGSTRVKDEEDRMWRDLDKVDAMFKAKLARDAFASGRLLTL